MAGSVTGNAGTATKLATARTITLSGDATASGTFDGSGNLTLATTLKNSGATAGSYGPGANATPAFGASFEVPEVTVDAKGRVTSIAERTVKLPAAPTSITGNAGTATKWATKRTVDGVQMDGSANVHHYGTCSTAAATAEKAVALTGFVLATGAVIRVKFTVTNTAANPTLNVNATGAKPVYYRGAAITAGTLAANRTYEFVYNGTQYELVGDVDTNTTYSLATATKDGLMAKADKSKLDGVAAGAEVNQNAFSKIVVGSTTIIADTEIDTLTLVAGTNITLTPDATNDKVTITAKDTTYTNMTGATASAAGKAGLAPAPAAGAQGKYLRGDGTWQTPPNTTYAVATQSANGLMSATDKKSVDYAEALRLSFIGVPRYWRSTTLPANHVWANGDLVLFSDWPELKKVYDAGGFTGMLLAYNANAATIAANLGKWRPNAANPTGLYVPKLGDQFFRAWTGGGDREAGSSQTDTGRNATGIIDTATWMRDVSGVLYATKAGRAVSGTGIDDEYDCLNIDLARVWGEHAGTEFAPTHIRIPVVFYLGNSA
ncbi:hypothetical protein [Bilophila wadsworthia]|uniref:hypothetical protein n=1 Tax=Bilophila wadsworthia TaxID=35833 RepID=UPI0026727E8C|nr:hypothetical protein [Bilophila wadsworthia]